MGSQRVRHDWATDTFPFSFSNKTGPDEESRAGRPEKQCLVVNPSRWSTWGISLRGPERETNPGVCQVPEHSGGNESEMKAYRGWLTTHCSWQGLFTAWIVFPVGGEMQLRALCWFGQGPERQSKVVRSRVVLLCLGLSLRTWEFKCQTGTVLATLWRKRVLKS